MSIIREKNGSNYNTSGKLQRNMLHVTFGHREHTYSCHVNTQHYSMHNGVEIHTATIIKNKVVKKHMHLPAASSSVMMTVLSRVSSSSVTCSRAPSAALAKVWLTATCTMFTIKPTICSTQANGRVGDSAYTHHSYSGNLIAMRWGYTYCVIPTGAQPTLSQGPCNFRSSR